MLVSIIIPIFNEPEDNIEELCARINEVFRDKIHEYEILFVDDGSNNNILEFLKILHLRDKRIKILSFNKNYGQINAFLAGLYHAKGEIIISMDADLQYPPEEIPYFLDKINQGYDAVWGKRRIEEVGFFSKKLTVFLNFILKIKFSDHGCTYNAFKKELINRIVSVGFPLCVKPLVFMSAKKNIEIDVTYNKRKRGESSYSFIGYLIFGIKYLVSFLIMDTRQLTPPFKIKLSMLD